MLAVGGLMVSRLPTFALKGWRISPFWVPPLFIVVVAIVAGFVTNTWLTLSATGTLYLLTLPVGWWSYRDRAKKEPA
jgi:CDP-diacylglycerol--serine O-phosphatidyltransferase